MGNEYKWERAFMRSLQELQASGVDEQQLLNEFVASHPLEQDTTLSADGARISVEEAFYHDLRMHPAVPEGSARFYLLTHEFLTALLTRVVREEEPTFVIETWQVRDNDTVRYALQRVPMKKAEFMCGQPLAGDREQLVVWLYAATKQGFVSRQISPFAAEVLEFKTPQLLQTVQEDLMSKYDLSTAAFDTQVQELRVIGLIAVE